MLMICTESYHAGSAATKRRARDWGVVWEARIIRDEELRIAGQAERAYEHFISQWQARRPKAERTSAAKEERR